jgi:hypothetical protein
LALRKFEGTRATLQARAGNLETLADDALAFVESAIIFAPRKSSSFRRALLRIQLEIDFHVVVVGLDKSGRGRINLADLFRNGRH